MNKGKWIAALAVVVLASAVVVNVASARLESETWDTPKLPAGTTVTIDGDPSEWMDFAWTDGVWTWERIQAQPWYNPEGISSSPRPTGEMEGTEAGSDDDFSVEFWSAWDDEGIVFAYSVTDNIFDNYSQPDSPSFAGGDIACVFLDTKGGSGTQQTAGYASYWFLAGTMSGELPESIAGQDVKRRISWPPKEGVQQGSQQYFGNDVPEALGRTIVDPVGAHPDALGGDWMFEARITWEGYLSTTDPPFLAPYEDKEMGWAWFIWDADGAGSEAIFYIAHDSNDGAPESSSWTTFVGGEVAVETSSWGQVKQLFK